jgi:thiamine-monophosphate kinase
MRGKKSLKEFRELDFLLQKIPRNPRQKNKLFESDCEIIKSDSSFLTISSDSICEEIVEKLYLDPFLWGWMTVMVSASDLAASGTLPIGILLATEWKFKTPLSTKVKFFSGVRAALKDSHLKLLGGDSGSAPEHFFNSSVLGKSKKMPLMRKKVRPGELVCLIGKKQPGAGPALALQFLFQFPKRFFLEKHYRPRPQPALIHQLRHLVSASIDTSDGLANSLDIISKINRVGFALVYRLEAMQPEALKFCEKAKLHPLMLWMSDHGDYQSLIFVPAKNLQKLQKITTDFVVLGRVTRNPKKVEVLYQETLIELPMKLLQSVGRTMTSLRQGNSKMQKYFSKIKALGT